MLHEWETYEPNPHFIQCKNCGFVVFHEEADNSWSLIPETCEDAIHRKFENRVADHET